MKTNLTRIHIGLGLSEVGVQFDMLDDGDKPTSKQRAFLMNPPEEIMAPVWAWARQALDSQFAGLPLDLPPSNVTTALMQQRNAEQMAEKARQAETRAKEEQTKADEARQSAEAMKAAAEADHARVSFEITKKRLESEALAVAHTARLAELDTAESAKKAELAALDAAIALKRTEVAKKG